MRSAASYLLTISIHALREEGDGCGPEELHGPSGFLSTPSARRATIRHDHTYQQGLISIHALREEGDFFHFDPSVQSSLFLSTPSARRATH